MFFMKKMMALILMLVGICICSVTAGAAEKFIVDTDFTDKIYSSDNMELYEYTEPLTNEAGTFSHQYTVIHPYTGGSSFGSVTYKVPDGATITSIELVLLRPLNDKGGWDIFTVKGGNNGSAGITIGTAAQIDASFNVVYNYKGGHGWHITSNDTTNRTLKSSGYDTIKIELNTVAQQKRPPIGLQLVKIGYSIPTLESVKAGKAELTDNSCIAAGAESIEFNFSSSIAKTEIAEDDIIIEKDGVGLAAELEKSGTKVTLKLSEALKYGCDYKIVFGDALQESGIDAIPEAIAFKTTESDFSVSEGTIYDDAGVAYAKMTIKNHTTEDKKAILYIASYKDSKILDAKFIAVDILKKGEGTELTSKEINSEGAEEIAVMLFDNLHDLNPLIKALKK